MTPKRLIPGSQLTTGAVAYYSAPGKTPAIVKRATATNTSGSARTVTVHLVPSGGTAAAENMIVSARNVPAGKTVDLYDLADHVLNAGDSIQALASAGAAVTLMASGIEI